MIWFDSHTLPTTCVFLMPIFLFLTVARDKGGKRKNDWYRYTQNMHTFVLILLLYFSYLFLFYDVFLVGFFLIRLILSLTFFMFFLLTTLLTIPVCSSIIEKLGHRKCMIYILGLFAFVYLGLGFQALVPMGFRPAYLIIFYILLLLKSKFK